LPTELIRKAAEADLQNLAAGAAEFYAASEFLTAFDIGRFCELWTELLGRDHGVIFVAEDQGLITGAIAGMIHRDIYGEALIAEEFFWFVRPETRGAGVRLYRAFEAWARERGAVSLQMVHLLDSMPAKVGAFYERLGFRAAEIRYTKTL
jgi:GNAT superfamily N-acetyltransferase